MRAALVGQAFNRPEKFFDAVTTFLEEIQVSELEDGFQDWVERVRWVLRHHGDYHHESTN
jgi:hypothetical protein